MLNASAELRKVALYQAIDTVNGARHAYISSNTMTGEVVGYEATDIVAVANVYYKFLQGISQSE